MLKHLFTCIFLLALINTSYSQTHVLALGTASQSEGGTTLVEGPNGDYFIGGHQENKGLITRVSPDGEVIWSKTIDFGSAPDHVLELDISSDNQLIGCGNARTSSGDNPYGFVFKMSLEGEMIWKRVINCDSHYMWAQAIHETTAGNYQVIGSFKNNYLDNYIIEFEPTNGNVNWDSLYVRNNPNNQWDESMYDLLVHPSNQSTYIVGRFMTKEGQISYRPSLTKLNPDGSLAWSKTYLYDENESGGRLYSFSIDMDGEALIFNILGKKFATQPPFEAGLIQTDLDGNINWAKLYTSTEGRDIRSYNMVNTPDGYLLAGWIENGDKELFMIKTDKSGNVVWSYRYGEAGTDETYLASSNSRVIIDGDYAVSVGRTNSFSNNFDILLLKVDLQTGRVADSDCYHDLPISQTDLPNFQADYPLSTFRLPVTSENPSVPIQDVQFDLSGDLIEAQTDTLVGGDTLIVCDVDRVNLETTWPFGVQLNWSTSQTTPLISATESGDYWVSVSGNRGCEIWTDTVHIIMENNFLDLGEDKNICDNQSSVLLDATQTQQADYEWQDGSTQSSLQVSSSGTYWVEVTLNGCVDRDTVDVGFSESPEVSLGNDTVVCDSDSLLLNAFFGRSDLSLAGPIQ